MAHKSSFDQVAKQKAIDKAMPEEAAGKAQIAAAGKQTPEIGRVRLYPR